MSSANFLFNSAELALATYSSLENGDTGNQRIALTQSAGAQMSIVNGV